MNDILTFSIAIEIPNDLELQVEHYPKSIVLFISWTIEHWTLNEYENWKQKLNLNVQFQSGWNVTEVSNSNHAKTW